MSERIIEVGILRVREGGPWHEAAIKRGLIGPLPPSSIPEKTWWVVARYDWYFRAQRGEWGNPQIFSNKVLAERYVSNFGGQYEYRWVMFECVAPKQTDEP